MRKRSGASQVALVVKNPPANAGDTGDLGSIHKWGRSPGVGSGNTLQHSCLENPIDRGALWPTVHSVTSDTTEAIEPTHMHGRGLGKFLRRWPACAVSQGPLSWPCDPRTKYFYSDASSNFSISILLQDNHNLGKADLIPMSSVSPLLLMRQHYM